jgi:hypothetical protein
MPLKAYDIPDSLSREIDDLESLIIESLPFIRNHLTGIKIAVSMFSIIIAEQLYQRESTREIFEKRELQKAHCILFYQNREKGTIKDEKDYY